VYRKKQNWGAKDTEHLFRVPNYGTTQRMNDITEERHWKKSGWNARIIKNGDDDGWAVEVTRLGDAEPTFVSPWTMGRDKKNPKPIDQGAFTQLIKTGTELIARQQNQAREKLHRQLAYRSDDGVSMLADFDLVPDDDDPHAMLTVRIEATGEVVQTARVAANFKVNAANVQRFVASGGTSL
jgi:hypothetical protein